MKNLGYSFRMVPLLFKSKMPVFVSAGNLANSGHFHLGGRTDGKQD